MERLLVIIVTYNAMKWVDRCFESLNTSTIPSDVFVVDNGSADKTVSYVKANYPDALMHVNKENLGFGRANNQGLQYAIDKGYEYVYLLNQDAWVMPDTFEKMINANKLYPEYGILSPVQLTATMDKFDRNFGNICMRSSRKCDFLENVYFGSSSVSNITGVMAAHWLISRECLLKVGGFSPAFPHYCEDDNYAERTIYKGFKVGIVNDARGVHDREYRTVTNDFKIYKSYVNAIRYFSNVNGYSSKYWIILTNASISRSIKFKKWRPLTYLVDLLGKKKLIDQYRIESMADGAFLKSPVVIKE